MPQRHSFDVLRQAFGAGASGGTAPRFSDLRLRGCRCRASMPVATGAWRGWATIIVPSLAAFNVLPHRGNSSPQSAQDGRSASTGYSSLVATVPSFSRRSGTRHFGPLLEYSRVFRL